MADEMEIEQNTVSAYTEPRSFPPYPPYETTPAPPSVADTIIAGHEIRYQFKSVLPAPVHRPPQPAAPRGPKATDVKQPKQVTKRHLRCMKQHGGVLTDRLDRMAKPQRRKIIYLWREYAEMLPPETITRLRAMLDADEPFKPEQAYQYFLNLRRSKKKSTAKARTRGMEKDILSIYGRKRFEWARNATVAFAKGVQNRLNRPGAINLTDGMLRLSDIILHEICMYMRMKKPSRRSTQPKAKFMMEIADKIAVWIDQILSESDDRMLMMDFDEDEDILDAGGDFDDQFLDMMGGDVGAGKKRKLLQELPAYLKFKGPMRDAFEHLVKCMKAQGGVNLVTHGKFDLSYADAATELLTATDFRSVDYNATLSNKISASLNGITKPNLPSALVDYMPDMLDICSKYLSQVAEYNKDKGKAFKLLIKMMKENAKDELFQKEKITKTYGTAATELEKAKGLESDHDDPNLSQDIHSKLKNMVDKTPPPSDLETDMKETLDVTSKYLSQAAIDELERGPAFDILIQELRDSGAEDFCEHPDLSTKHNVAYVLMSAPGLSGVTPDTKTAPNFKTLLHDVVDAATPTNLKEDMDEVVNRCANYLSAFIRDRDKAKQKLLEMMKKNGKNIFASRPNYTMDYTTGAMEVETAPSIIPYHPVKEIADEGKKNLTRDMANETPPELKIATKALITDVSRHLSQSFALRSAIAGPRYNVEFLAAVKKSHGKKSLFKVQHYGQSYADAASTILHAGPLKIDEPQGSSRFLHHQIKTEMGKGVPAKLAPTIADEINVTMEDASKHLAHVGTQKEKAMAHLVGIMKDKGETPLATLQGYDQSHDDGARRLQTAETYRNPTVDKAAYEKVKTKLTALAKDKPQNLAPDHVDHMPEVVEMSAKYLAAPEPETQAEKRKVLGDIMGRAGEKLVGEQGAYKMTHFEGAEEVQKAKIGVTTAHDEKKKEDIKTTIEAVIPNEKMKDILKEPLQEGAAHIADTVSGRAQALEIIEKSLKKEKEKELVTLGKFNATHEGGATIVGEAPHFYQKEQPPPMLTENIEAKVDAALPTTLPANIEKKHLEDVKKMASKYVASVAVKESGLTPEQILALEESQAQAKSSAAVISKGGLSASQMALAAQSGGLDADAAARAAAAAAAAAAAKAAAAAAAAAEAERNRLARLRAEEAQKSLGLNSPEHQQALQILQKELTSRGATVLYEEPPTAVSHQQAAQWITSPPTEIDHRVRDSADTAHLKQKLKPKLHKIVDPVTPPNLTPQMIDIVDDSAQKISEQFVAESYEQKSRDAVIAGLQNKRSAILIEKDGKPETSYYAAQRLKKAPKFETDDGSAPVEEAVLTEKIDECMRQHSMPRTIAPAVKEKSKDAAKYLSTKVTKSDEHIEALVTLLKEMEKVPDKPIIQGEQTKTHGEAAHYLRRLVTFEDKINRPNPQVHSEVEKNLKILMAPKPPVGYTQPMMDRVVQEQAKLYTSYVMLEDEKTKALKSVVDELDNKGKTMLLRYGHVRKSHKDGAELLRGKKAAHLLLDESPDEIVVRKLDLKITDMMENTTPEIFKPIMPAVIQDVNHYLAKHLFEPRVIKICKCMKNATIQCELRTEECLRYVLRQPCTCSRYIDVQDVEELGPDPVKLVCPGTAQKTASNIELSVKQCRKMQPKKEDCDSKNPSRFCTETHYVHYSTRFNAPKVTSSRLNRNYEDDNPTRIPRRIKREDSSINKHQTPSTSAVQKLIRDLHQQNMQCCTHNDNDEYYTGLRTSSKSVLTSPIIQESESLIFTSLSTVNPPTRTSSPAAFSNTLSSNYNSPTPITMSEQMGDWQAMIVSLMWNMQAWRKWIQETIDKGLLINESEQDLSSEAMEDDWLAFQRKVSTEGLQWRQYNIFSRQLSLRLISRYQNKEIVSCQLDGSEEILAQNYKECAAEMIGIIDMLNRWTQWILLIIRETPIQKHASSTSLKPPTSWGYYKKKIVEYSNDWVKYNLHIKLCWEQKYKSFFMNSEIGTSDLSPVWVVSACGAVPSGAVAGGIYDGEIIWIARTTHKNRVLPAALHPSKHCCLVYADGVVCHYTKYQVMCNAEVKWVPWRGGSECAHAVCAAQGVFIGRVLYRESHLIGPIYAPTYRCHVIVFGRSFAFNCYELLVMADQSK